MKCFKRDNKVKHSCPTQENNCNICGGPTVPDPLNVYATSQQIDKNIVNLNNSTSLPHLIFSAAKQFPSAAPQ